MHTLKETAKFTGLVNLKRINSSGEVIQEMEIPNLVVTTGKNHIASKITATTNTPASMTHMGIGTGTTGAVLANTQLEAQTTRQALTGSTPTNNTITYTCTFNAGVGDGAITEAGIFNSASTGNMLCRTNFNVVNKDVTDILLITWQLTIV